MAQIIQNRKIEQVQDRLMGFCIKILIAGAGLLVGGGLLGWALGVKTKLGMWLGGCLQILGLIFLVLFPLSFAG